MPRKLNIDWDAVGLGMIPDVELAATLVVSTRLIQQKRSERGIHAVSRVFPNGHKVGINWDKEPLGKIPDEILGQRVGIDPRTVREARRTRGIPAYTAQKRDGRLAGKTDACIDQALLLTPTEVPEHVDELISVLTANGWSIIFTPE